MNQCENSVERGKIRTKSVENQEKTIKGIIFAFMVGGSFGLVGSVVDFHPGGPRSNPGGDGWEIKGIIFAYLSLIHI